MKLERNENNFGHECGREFVWGGPKPWRNQDDEKGG